MTYVQEGRLIQLLKRLGIHNLDSGHRRFQLVEILGCTAILQCGADMACLM